MYQYLQTMQNIFLNGNDRGDRTGTGTRSLFGEVNLTFDLERYGIPTVPLLTTKSVHLKSIIHELLWMLQGDTNVRYLKENGVRIWDEWADANGELGPVYGAQWRAWEDTRIINASEIYSGDAWAKYGARGFVHEGELPNNRLVISRKIDQLLNLEARLKSNPECRRLIMSAWNVGRIDEMKLPPCHTLAQWYTEEDSEGEKLLSCKLYMRSADWFLGVPFNIVFYSILTHMLAAIHGYTPKKFYLAVGDAHIYHNHFDQVREQLGRQPFNNQIPEITLTASHANGSDYTSVLDFKFDDIQVTDYFPQPAIKAPVAV